MATSRPSLGNLPEELLVQIIEYSTLEGFCYIPRDHVYRIRRVYSDLTSLSLVCHRFHRLATPFLYQGISLYDGHPHSSDNKEYSIVPPCPRALALHRVLRDNPPLRSMCLDLEMVFDDEAEITDEDFRVANDLVSWLGRTQSLRLYGGFPWGGSDSGQRENTLGLIYYATRSMTNLKEFLLDMGNDTNEGLSLLEAMEYINFPSLEILSMTGNGHSEDWRPMPSSNSEEPRTAPFTCLSLAYCKDSVEAIEKCISWPKDLVDFTINTSGNEEVAHLSLMDAQSWLLNHKETLKYAYIDLLGHNQGIQEFDASIFPRLESLTLSRTQLNDDVGDGVQNNLCWESSHPDRLLPPNLKTFGMSFGILGCCLINNFGDKEVSWLRQLGQAAASRQSSLETIDILFQPWSEYPHKYGNYPDDHGYPWDRMSGLRDELAEYGISLIYTPAPWTKEEWEERIAKWLKGSARARFEHQSGHEQGYY
ncbi:hypothetical protein N7509_002221 [Penicillium cosmopolitanum]|uniref:F-box domain-containing protein n=1 Tax=Penicillium cosmopolitanum TaxID=1131564 RepID=A0A9W9W8S4_9EURO|nr:uncharacterized protein N7509_002221 [Penicillium cosmopolitanum]KAJ5408338.1 hypothetical protein N7509_002221 [Penicillium cosmopolitanum]